MSESKQVVEAVRKLEQKVEALEQAVERWWEDATFEGERQKEARQRGL